MWETTEADEAATAAAWDEAIEATAAAAAETAAIEEAHDVVGLSERWASARRNKLNQR